MVKDYFETTNNYGSEIFLLIFGTDVNRRFERV